MKKSEGESEGSFGTAVQKNSIFQADLVAFIVQRRS